MNKNEKNYLYGVRQMVGRAINQYQLIQNGDKIAVGVSGGKDSLILLESLALRRKYLPIHYDIVAAHVKITNLPYQINRSFFEDFCNELNVQFIYHEIAIDLEKKTHKTPCFICSWSRRRELFNLTREIDCNKLALGHHKDDAVETLLLNMVYHGSFSSLPPNLSMFDGRMKLIRPLLLLRDTELQKYADIRAYPKQLRVCPYENATQRATMRNMITRFEEILPAACDNIFKAMGNIFEEYLPPALEKKNYKIPTKKSTNNKA